MSALYHYAECGLDNIWLANGFIHRKTPYGPGISFQDIDQLDMLLALKLVDKPARLTGKEFRYLRTLLHLSQAEVARAHGVGEQVVSLWERHGKVPKTNDVLLRLRYLAHAGAVDKMPAVLERMNEVERPGRQRLIGRKTTRGWRVTVESEAMTPDGRTLVAA